MSELDLLVDRRIEMKEAAVEFFVHPPFCICGKAKPKNKYKNINYNLMSHVCFVD